MRLRSDPAGVAYSTLRLSIAGLKGPLCGREGRAGWRGEDGNSGRDSIRNGRKGRVGIE